MPSEISINSEGIELKGILNLVKEAGSLVLFSHGSGSGLDSPRNKFVSEELNKRGISTLLISLLSDDEDLIQESRFNIDLLTERLVSIVRWLKRQNETKNLVIGLFGASTGAASALETAAKFGTDIKAIVLRGGRPDLAINYIDRVVSPTLFIVGEKDEKVLELNRQAFEKMTAEKKMEIIPGATHLFEEEGALEQVSQLTGEWFDKYLSRGPKL